MNAELKATVIPILRGMGFKGSMPHFRRRHADRIDMLTFQFDQGGGGFVVEIAKCGPDGCTMPWGEQVPPNKATAHHVSAPRPRLRPSGADEDHWFRYDNGLTPRDAVQELVPLLATVAEAWWNAG